jgi:hypothetical protein
MNTDASLVEQEQEKPYLTCRDLVERGRWDPKLCDPECHSDANLLISCMVTDHDPLQELRHAYLCCQAYGLLSDWYPGKVITVFPEHDW